MTAKGRSILVAVEPVVLEGALALLIERLQLAEVVQFHSASDALDRRYYVAVVCPPTAHDVQADVLITLSVSGARMASVTQGGTTTWAVVESHHHILELVARCWPISHAPTIVEPVKGRGPPVSGA